MNSEPEIEIDFDNNTKMYHDWRGLLDDLCEWR